MQMKRKDNGNTVALTFARIFIHSDLFWCRFFFKFVVLYTTRQNMKSILSILCLLFALVISCGTQDKRSLAEKIQGKKTDTVVDSLKIRVLKEYFSNGKVKTETEAKGNLRHGLTKSYDREGHLLSQVTYVNNVREGMATNFYPLTGKVNSTLIYKNGIKEGDEIWYYESGTTLQGVPLL